MANVPAQQALTDPIPANVCSQMVESATRSCQPLIQMPAEPAVTTADSLAALSTAFTFGSILLAMIALVGAVAWGFVVKVWAEREARAEAQKIAKECADEWLAKNAPAIIQRYLELLRDPTVGGDDEAEAADNMGEGA